MDTRALRADAAFTNGTGMRMVRVEPGTFLMGTSGPLPEHLVRLPNRRYGDFDERPAHRVTISRPYYLGATEVTNTEYECFNPAHRTFRGKLGFSTADDEAAVFVSWHEAAAFCEWLAARDGLPYRLPTEAEWEYACRAGTRSAFSTGDELPPEYHRNQAVSWYPDPARSTAADVVPLPVGRTPANPWGLFDMHGNVEEWCLDWYAPYEPGDQTDPVGPADGDFRVARGGSHSTEVYYLRSANRAATLPDERSWLIGFRVACGEMPATSPVRSQPPELWATDVGPETIRVRAGARVAEEAPDPATPYFRGPRVYVKVPPGADGPIFAHHNHVPAIAPCPNGDLLAVWYTCREEAGREVATVGSRLRFGPRGLAGEWDPASMFWDAPDRNDHASALWFDGDRTIYHFCGLSVAATWGPLATIVRTSTDSGATWSRARFIMPEHGLRHMPIAGVFRMADGTIVLPCDAVTGGAGGSALWLSEDGGESWHDAGGTIAGIHAGVAELDDGRLLAYGRGDEVDGMMPMSVSRDRGATWRYTASPFPPIRGGQRVVLRKLREGPLLFASFANDDLRIVDAAGVRRPIRGLYCAISLDDGRTWANFRPISDDGPERLVETMDGYFRPMGRSVSELAGYITSCQTADGLVHLISSRNDYAFNLAWLTTPPPPLDA